MSVVPVRKHALENPRLPSRTLNLANPSTLYDLYHCQLFLRAPRQWARLVEMVLLLSIDPSDSQQIKALRLAIKARIYRKNKDVLVDLSPEERKEKLQETYEGLLDAGESCL